MQFASQRLVDVFVAAPVGRIDHPNAERLQQALAPILDEAARPGNALVIDFSHVEYISSMGLRVLMMAARQLRAADARIAVGTTQATGGATLAATLLRSGHRALTIACLTPGERPEGIAAEDLERATRLINAIARGLDAL